MNTQQNYKPIIGIVCRGHPTPGSNSMVFGIYQTYLESISKSGGVPIIIYSQFDEAAIRASYELCDGILLAGGEDVDPKHYGEKPHVNLGNTVPERDFTEINLVRWAAEDRKPILCICRGVQLMNVALGGSLYQDIPSELNLEIHGDKRSYACQEQTLHTLTIEANSKLRQILERTSIPANSWHHQSIKQIAPKMKVVAHDETGVIEAIESNCDWFAIGVQCHPECHWQEEEPSWLNLFLALVCAASDKKA